MTEMIFQMISALALVLLLIFVFAFLYRKKNKGGRLISILSYQSLGQKMGVAAVKIGGEIMVFGITPTDFKLIKRFDDVAADSPSPDGCRGGTGIPQSPEGEAATAKKSFRGKKTAGTGEAGTRSGTLAMLKKIKGEIDG